jgi:hypothetical protein
MENLHLKNLKEFDLIDNNLEKIHELKIKLEKLSIITLEYLITELKEIKIKNSTINELKERYLQNIIKNKSTFKKEYYLYDIQEFINEINKLKNITLNSIINPQDYETYNSEYNRYTKTIKITIMYCTLYREANHEKTWLTLLLTYNKLNNTIQNIEIEETYYK